MKRRLNFRKANWKGFKTESESLISRLKSKPENYDKFVKLLKKSARKYIPRGCRIDYIPGLTKETKLLYDKYQNKFKENPFNEDTFKLGESITAQLAAVQQERWIQFVESTDLTQNSRKAWHNIRKISNDPTKPSSQYEITANQMAHVLIKNGKIQVMKKQSKIEIPYSKYSTDGHKSLLSEEFTLHELNEAIKTLVNGKASRIDDINTKLLKQLGPNCQKWLLKMFHACFRENNTPKVWRKVKTIAILKPGKNPQEPKNFRPISLLCHTYKLLERMILNRLLPILDEKLIPEQAGFRPGRSCTGQILKLTQHIEDGFEKGMVSGAIFIDLSAAHDTINYRKLLYKRLEITKNSSLTKFTKTMLSNRRFYVILNGKRSKWRNQKNGPSHGSVLAPLLFNIYTNDQPLPESTQRFLYADDLCITAQNKSFEMVEQYLRKALPIFLILSKQPTKKQSGKNTILSISPTQPSCYPQNERNMEWNTNLARQISRILGRHNG